MICEKCQTNESGDYHICPDCWSEANGYTANIPNKGKSGIHRKINGYHRKGETCIANKNGEDKNGDVCKGFEKSEHRNECMYVDPGTNMCWIFDIE